MKDGHEDSAREGAQTARPNQVADKNLKERLSIYPDPIEHARQYALHLETKEKEIKQGMRKYQSKEVSDDEWSRTLDTLKSLDKISQYFSNHNVSEKTAVFLASNLPLSLFFLYGVILSYQSKSVVVRPPQSIREPFRELYRELEIEKFFPNISVSEDTREDFVENHCSTASVVVFTGKETGYQKIRERCSEDTLVIYNGTGNNPIVVAEDADIKLAVKKSIELQTFNSGRDCANAKMFLVHSAIIAKYLEELKRQLQDVKCGEDYTDDKTIVGPIPEHATILNITDIVLRQMASGAHKIYGGNIDISTKVMNPTIIRIAPESEANYTELYAPLFLIKEYKENSELKKYFEDPRYGKNAMYVYWFGTYQEMPSMRNSIILQNRTIHDINEGSGNQEFGGYGPGASGFSYKRVHVARPQLLPETLYTWAQQKDIFDGYDHLKGIDKERRIIEVEFQKTVTEIFGDNLIFAFLRDRNENEKVTKNSHMKAFICTKETDSIQVEKYLEWSFETQQLFGIRPDLVRPVEAMSYEELQKAIASLATMDFSNATNSDKYKAVVWGLALTQSKRGIIGHDNIPVHFENIFDLNAIYNILKEIPFEGKRLYAEIVQRLVFAREFLGNDGTIDPNSIYDPAFSWGPIGNQP